MGQVCQTFKAMGEMKRKILLLILLNISSPGNCINQVPVLKYKGGNECSSDLVVVPINSTSSILGEFTFCGKYSSSRMFSNEHGT